MDTEIKLYGRFAVLDRGVRAGERDRAARGPRYAVIEHDKHGPILRAGPFCHFYEADNEARWLSRQEQAPVTH